MSNDTLQITESYNYDVSYNRVQSIRRLTDRKTGRMTTHTTYSLGGCYDNDGVAERLWLGGGYYGAPEVLEVTDTMQYRYVMRDHLGSITHVYYIDLSRMNNFRNIEKAIWQFAGGTNHAFRINGVTYYKKEE